MLSDCSIQFLIEITYRYYHCYVTLCVVAFRLVAYSYIYACVLYTAVRFLYSFVLSAYWRLTLLATSRESDMLGYNSEATLIEQWLSSMTQFPFFHWIP